MKKILTIGVIIFCTVVSAWGGSLEDNIKDIIKNAERGDATLQCNLGELYAEGIGVSQDYKQALYWYTKSAEQGYAEAQYLLGFLYKNGQGVAQDYKQAVYWFIKSAEQGHSGAQRILGFMYSDGQGVTQDYKQAFDWYKKAAEQGNAELQHFLGLSYLLGKGVAQDHKQAVYWFTKSAEQGYAEAQLNLGDLYFKGKGVTQDYKQAFDWYKKASEQGYAGAQTNLGYMYGAGKGVPQNSVLGYVWGSLAAAQGDELAAKNRDIEARSLSSQQLVQAQELAAEIQKKIENPPQPKDIQPSIAETEKKITASGTGFIITRNGYVLTCHHVIKDARSIKIVMDGTQHPAKLIRDDPHNDLALLKINGTFPALAFSSQRSAKMGQEVFTIGFPNPALQGVSAKFGKGTINSLSGFQDDLRLYQISIPVQPGNSGGALLDNDGNILGVIVAMLDAKTTFKITGSLPQSVNYAIKGIYAQAMLDTVPEVADKLISPSKSKINAVERVKESTVMVLSY